MSKHNKGNGIQVEIENATMWVLNKDFTPTGRIKRMRNPKKMQDYFRGKSIRLKAVKDKYHIWELLWLQNCEYIFPLTRWNRH